MSAVNILSSVIFDIPTGGYLSVVPEYNMQRTKNADLPLECQNGARMAHIQFHMIHQTFVFVYLFFVDNVTSLPD